MSIRADALGVWRLPCGFSVDIQPDHYVCSEKGPIGVTITAPDAMTTHDGCLSWRYFPDELKWKATGDVVMQSVLCIDH